MTAADVKTGEGTQTGLNERIVRYRDLVPCRNAFIDTRTPGSQEKENFTIIGPGVSENPEQYVHIAEPHGFNIGGARQPPHCVNSQHSHDTAETFVVHSGRWRFDFGEEGTDAQVEAGPGDIVSFPTQAFRGFVNIGTDTGFLWSVLGGDDPGRVLWAPKVFALARDYGLMLMENGALVDTARGDRPPEGIRPMTPTSAADVARLSRISQNVANGLVVRAEAQGVSGQGWGQLPGVAELAIIGAASPDENLPAGAFAWPHGFSVRKLTLQQGAAIPDHRRAAAEVLFVHAGALEIVVDGAAARLDPGDTITIPVGARRAYGSAEGATVFVVHGGDRAVPVENA
ncbi:cupin domain-containing protein [Sphingobium algorifonticola]|uniref:Cupin domain-containing protein n=1 Tax=Sphingobium algorifonticola TaxID=2008318 RepID=A0A437J9K8_9SPHN|nr:cupin domain-containing protein [Sphingobium algorifonticola]RVT41992.1 cupin domain-containing protein [Sphingobium algorifonticola]